MVRASYLFPIVLLPVLSACGSSAQLSSTGSISPAISSDSNTTSSDPTSGNASGSSITGFAAGSGGELVSVSVRLSEDGSLAWVSVGGGTETEWSGGGTSSSGEWKNGSTVLLISDNGDVSDVQVGDAFVGFVGALTDVGALPSGTVSYRGAWHTISTDGDGRGNGSLRLDLDFANGRIGGDLVGAYARAGAGGGAVKGDVDGSIAEATISGSVQINERNVSGTLVFLGGVYGNSGERVQGMLGGEMTTALGTDTQTGNFSLSSTGN